MKVLGIETATSLCGVGLADEKGMVADFRLHQGYVHAERLSFAVEQVLTHAGLTLNDIAGLAVSIGPGSYTGLRIGLGLVKGLALGTGLPVAAVPTLDALMLNIPPVKSAACVMTLARKIEVYQGFYRWNGKVWNREGDFQVVLQDDLGKDLPEEDMIFLGEGVHKFKDILQTQFVNGIFLPPVYSFTSGYNVAEIGRNMLLKGQNSDIHSLVPTYKKRFQGIA